MCLPGFWWCPSCTERKFVWCCHYILTLLCSSYESVGHLRRRFWPYSLTHLRCQSFLRRSRLTNSDCLRPRRRSGPAKIRLGQKRLFSDTRLDQSRWFLAGLSLYLLPFARLECSRLTEPRRNPS